jgi:YD repeat-containing protein
MKNVLILLCLLLATATQAQFYYNDIIGTAETNSQMKSYLVNKVKTASAVGADRSGSRSNDFSEYHEVRENSTALKSTSIVNRNKSVIYSRFDNMGRVISMTDSSTTVESITTYEYDAAGRVAKVQNKINDPDNGFVQTETHQWIYNAGGKPEKMWRIVAVTGKVNSIDTTEIRFVLDEDGNVGEEHTYLKNYETGYLYYYYDDKDRLSDIVRYNNKSKKLLPDIMFEHDDEGRVIQKTVISYRAVQGSTTLVVTVPNSLIFRYIYDDKGLKKTEALFNNDKEMTGRINFTYTFFQ